MTCRALFSLPVTTVPSSWRTGLPRASTCGTPALRKYLLTMMSVASCDQNSGTSASVISKTTLPSGFVMRLVRLSHLTVSNTDWSAARSLVNWRVIRIVASLG